MTKTRKTVVAGALVAEAIYPRIERGDSPKARAAKSKLSSAAQQALNARYSWQKLMFVLAANYRPGDLIVTLTFADRDLPGTRAKVSARLKKFREQLRPHYARHGLEMRCVWAIESKHGEGRWHIHCVLPACPKVYAAIVSAWPHGAVDIRRLKLDHEHSYQGLAIYMAKEARDKVGLKAWSYTRNCRKPERDTRRVDDDRPLQAPRGSLLLESSSEKNRYGAYQYILYLAPGYDRAPKRRENNRKQRRL